MIELKKIFKTIRRFLKEGSNIRKISSTNSSTSTRIVTVTHRVSDYEIEKRRKIVNEVIPEIAKTIHQKFGIRLWHHNIPIDIAPQTYTSSFHGWEKLRERSNRVIVEYSCASIKDIEDMIANLIRHGEKINYISTEWEAHYNIMNIYLRIQTDNETYMIKLKPNMHTKVTRILRNGEIIDSRSKITLNELPKVQTDTVTDWKPRYDVEILNILCDPYEPLDKCIERLEELKNSDKTFQKLEQEIKQLEEELKNYYMNRT